MILTVSYTYFILYVILFIKNLLIILIDLSSRYGHSMTQIQDNYLMIFGGYDMNDNVVSKQDLIDLSNNTYSSIENTQKADFPTSRAFHQIIKIGTFCLLYGGRTSTGENLNDVWKFFINKRKWEKIVEYKTHEFYLFRSGFIFTKIAGKERPVIYGGENRNKEVNNDVIILDYPICATDESAMSSNICLPCSEGYIANRLGKCDPCLEGTYHNFDADKGTYVDSSCKNCPAATFNNKKAASTINGCQICGFNTYNPDVGKFECTKCPNKKICLPGNVNK